MPATAAATLAMDIGGANTKAARLDGDSLRTVSRPFEVWRDREALADVLREVVAEVGPARAVAICAPATSKKGRPASLARKARSHRIMPSAQPSAAQTAPRMPNRTSMPFPTLRIA